MQVRVFSLSLLVAAVFCSVLLMGGTVLADDASTLREAQAALDKADYDQAVRVLKPLVDSGNAEALYVMGRLILEGKGVKKNNTRAAEFFSMPMARAYPRTKPPPLTGTPVPPIRGWLRLSIPLAGPT